MSIKSDFEEEMQDTGRVLSHWSEDISTLGAKEEYVPNDIDEFEKHKRRTEAPDKLDQPMPLKNTGPDIMQLVADDFKNVFVDGKEKIYQDVLDRREVGIKRYGTTLQPFNGRDAIKDAYAEALDLCVYLRQALEELKSKPDVQFAELAYIESMYISAKVLAISLGRK